MENTSMDNELSLRETICKRDIEKLIHLLNNRNFFEIDEAIADTSTILHLAVRKKNEKMVKTLVENGANVKNKNKKGENPLHIAAEIGNANLAKLFLARGTSIDVLTKDRLTPLHIAVKNNRIDVLELLLKNNAKINTQNIVGDSPLHDAVRYGFISLIELLLRCGADPNCMNDAKESPFHESFIRCNIDLTKLFFSRNVNFRLKNYLGENALHLAAKFSTYEIVERLLEMNLSCNESTIIGSPPLHYAIENKNCSEEMSLDIVRLLLKYGADIEKRDRNGKTALVIAIENQCFKLTEYLLFMGANVNRGENVNEIPLFAAIEIGDFKLVAYLLENGANVDVKNKKNEGPLHTAIRVFHNEEIRYNMVDLLLTFGANINDRDFEKSTALHLALEKRDRNLFELLIANNASVHYKNSHRWSPIFVAVRKNIFSAVSTLLDLGANVNDLDINEKGLLAEAIDQNNEFLVELLLRYSADPKDRKALSLASRKGNVDVMKMLVSAGADINSVDESGFSVLVNAILQGQQSMVQYLLENGADVNFERDKCLPLNHAFFIFYSHRSVTSKLVMYLLLKHIALLASRGFRVHEINVQLIRANKVMADKYDSYRNELDKMKSTYVCPEFPVTYFDLLVKRNDALVRCLRCQEVRIAFITGDYKKRFVKYFHRMEINYYHGWKRLQVIDKFHRSMNEIFSSILPSEVVYKISEYLSDNDF